MEVKTKFFFIILFIASACEDNDVKLNISTNEADQITSISAMVGGSVTVVGKGTVSERGICWSTQMLPTINDLNDYKVSSTYGPGDFTLKLSKLTPSVKYYARSYAITSSGVQYGNSITFTTSNQLVIDEDIIDQFLLNNNITAIQDPSGLRYVIKIQGTGKTPTESSLISFNFIVKRLTGEIISSGTENLKQLKVYIEGLQIGLQLINEGTDATFYIPSDYAYGPDGAGNIEPNEILVIDIQLTQVL